MHQLSREEISRCFRTPLVLNADRTNAIRQFMREALGLTIPMLDWSGDLPCDRWEFCFDSENRNIESDPPNAPYIERKATWRCVFAVSLRGPFITCWTSSVVAGNSGPTKDYTLRSDAPPRTLALEWTMKIANQFGLAYLDALELIEWPVENSEAPDDLWSYINYDDPNAFNILFCEF